MIIGYKSRRGLFRYLGMLLLTIIVFLVVIGLLFLFKASSILSDIIFWVVFGAIILLILALMTFQYLLLPKILLTVKDHAVTLHFSWKREVVIPFNEIVSIGLLPEPKAILFPAENLVIVTKTRGTYAVSFLKNHREILQQILTVFNNYIVDSADIYFKS